MNRNQTARRRRWHRRWVWWRRLVENVFAVVFDLEPRVVYVEAKREPPIDDPPDLPIREIYAESEQTFDYQIDAKIPIELFNLAGAIYEHGLEITVEISDGTRVTFPHVLVTGMQVSQPGEWSASSEP